MVESKALEVEKLTTNKWKRKKRGGKKHKAPSAATASPAEALSEVLSDDSDSPSPAMMKKKVELLETTATNMERLKERLKTDIHEERLTGPSLLPLTPLRLKFRVKKSTM